MTNVERTTLSRPGSGRNFAGMESQTPRPMRTAFRSPSVGQSRVIRWKYWNSRGSRHGRPPSTDRLSPCLHQTALRRTFAPMIPLAATAALRCTGGTDSISSSFAGIPVVLRRYVQSECSTLISVVLCGGNWLPNCAYTRHLKSP